ncbi:MAG: glycosidase [Lentisphaerae bacterium]|nr:glycosidase [Lentisphaerota bacterium]
MMVERTEVILRPDPKRVLIRFFSPGSPDRIERIISRVLSLDQKKIKQRLEVVCGHFGGRHDDILAVFRRHYEVVAPYTVTDTTPSHDQQLLIGAYFTSEYALESAALFNPSIVPHPDQSGQDEGRLRIILSLRATGEGHVSSLVFREGIIDERGLICMEPSGQIVTGPELVQNSSYSKETFGAKLYELGYDNDITADILGGLDGEFTLAGLKEQIARGRTSVRRYGADQEDTFRVILELAEQQYEIRFTGTRPISERVIFPRIDHQRKAIEDARFVRFEEDNGEVMYYATYTAYDGRTFLPQLLQTPDFCAFRFITLNGAGVMNKGMALFPRRINGRYAMLSRQDGENIYIMFSDHLHFWQEPKIIMKPTSSWEFVQLGNCGSPIETPAGWLVLTHGVGAMRRYCIGAVLLDLDNPGKVIGRLKSPLLEPDENERDGYVPNVVYTCGALIHGKWLVVPYAMSDYATRIALVDLDALLQKLASSS